ncbi:hypothetical protein M408DRAFT_73453 [Serendipita vermifera MAFF 305830]|uniref:triacylglycerol lipase n=1 Tax=Serendipita vermifera MAFF 305830 TaxID=933852 RepID=A0A0C3B1E2_SERVB|nr:hypothetical protein M408DRAFT_73453 [Serendipita vermifera MAFF 305830]
MYIPKVFTWALWPWAPEPQKTSLKPLEFTLRHVHAHTGARVVFKDVMEHQRLSIAETTPEFSTSFTLTPRSTKVHRPRSQQQFFQAQEASRNRLRKRRRGELVEDDEISVAWDEWDVPGPDTGSRDALLVLAKMSWNTYILPEDPQWYDLSDWGTTYPFGWEPSDDGLRGHVFVSTDNSTVVVSIKGTSASGVGGGPTVGKDKLNDNLLFSCCCARVGPTWSPVCGCYGGKYRCDENCVQEALVEESLFYPVGTNLYNNISYIYPEANIWVTGHSLGGALSGLMGVTFGLPVVTFEAPAERMASRRLHLPQPPEIQHITHVFHTADPIPMGTCTGVLSSCAIAGYAMESRCHLGKKRLYDTVTKYGWSQDVRTHRIGVIIDRLLAEDWEEGKPVPDETVDGSDCDDQECYAWEFGEFLNKSSSSSC